MPIKRRNIKNKRRGTEIGFATIPLSEFNSSQIYRDLSRAISQFYKAEGINQSKESKVFEGRSYSPPSDVEYAVGYNVGENTRDDEALREKVAELREFVDSDRKEILLPLRGKEIQGDRGKKIEYHLLALKKVGKNLLIRPQPLIHTIRWVATPEDHGEFSEAFSSKYFETLKSILSKGFVSPHGSTDGNVYPKKSKDHVFNENYDPSKYIKGEPSITSGDSYSLELFFDKGYPYYRNDALEMHTIESASPQRISAVNIHLARNLSNPEKRKKMKFYSEQITQQYGVPVRFFEDSKDSKLKRIFRHDSLEQKLTSVIAITGFVGSLIFLQTNITGNAIADLSTKTTSWVGGVLLVIGLVAGFFWIKNKKKNPVVKKKK